MRTYTHAAATQSKLVYGPILLRLVLKKRFRKMQKSTCGDSQNARCRWIL